MTNRSTLLSAALAIFLAALGLSWLTQGRGVVHNDPKHHISVPTALTVPLDVQAAYNGQDIAFR